MSKQSKDKVVSFEEEAHEYTIGDKVLISGTSFLSQFFEKFDADAIATKLSKFPINKKNKMTKAKFLREWKEGAEHGTRVHLLIESYLLRQDIQKTKVEFRDIAKSFWGITYLTENGITNCTPEFIVYNEEFGIAGQIDLLQEDDTTFSLYDWKTNKRLDTTSKYGKKASAPISHLDDCHYTKYMLQLNLYAYMYSKATGKECKSLHLIHLEEDRYNEFVVPIQYELIERLLQWTKTL
jgi:ATP-dependent exoDNAse (exonuclease V) beta subunit